MNQVQPLIDLLSARYGWLPAVMGWMSASRLAMKFFSTQLQAKLTELMAEAASDKDEANDRDWEAVLGARWYRVAAFTLDLVLSVKLPSISDFRKAKGPSNNNQ